MANNFIKWNFSANLSHKRENKIKTGQNDFSAGMHITDNIWTQVRSLSAIILIFL